MSRKPPKSKPAKLEAAGYGISTETGADRFFLVIVESGVRRTFDFGSTDATRMSGTLDQYFAWRNDPDTKKG